MTAVLTANWNFPTRIWSGPGRIGELAAACALAGIERPLIVTDKGLADSLIIANVSAVLAKAGLASAVFAEVQGNPVGRNVDDGVALYRAGGHDGVIAVGGGSGLDVGKAIAFMSGQSRPLWDFEDVGDWSSRSRRQRAPVPKSGAPPSSSRRTRTKRRSFFTPACCPLW